MSSELNSGVACWKTTAIIAVALSRLMMSAGVNAGMTNELQYALPPLASHPLVIARLASHDSPSR